MTTADLSDIQPLSKGSEVVQLTPYKSPSLWQSVVRRLRRDRLTLAALTVLVFLTIACVLGPPVLEGVFELDQTRTNVGDRYLPPGSGIHILGTDQLGRDQLLRLMYGGRVSLSIAYGASVLSITIGVLLGVISGYFGGILDDIINWVINTLSSIPVIFLFILISTAWEPSAETLIVLFGLLGWITTCRLVRSEVLALKQREFIIAAQSIGASPRHVILSHLLPNMISLVIVSLSIEAGVLILAESALSYLGLGVRPPTASWGNMLTTARTYFVTGVHLVVFPGLLIIITVLCFFVIGDGLRDALDPRYARK
jgi:peptide/nickel transport system permease protein